MGAVENYYNVRDSKGRFAKKTTSKKSAKKKTVSKKVDNKHKEIYDMFILDKSGSMQSVLNETISGFNEVLKTNKQIFKDTNIPSFCSLVEFSYSFDIVEKYLNKAVGDCVELNTENYIPSGMTALYDAIGFGIMNLKNNLKDKLNNKNIQVTVTILTDGDENASKKWTSNKINELVSEMRDKYNWTINFIGAGSDKTVKAVADKMGIFASNTMSYTADSIGTKAAFRGYADARDLKSKTFADTGENKNFGFFSND